MDQDFLKLLRQLAAFIAIAIALFAAGIWLTLEISFALTWDSPNGVTWWESESGAGLALAGAALALLAAAIYGSLVLLRRGE